MKTEKTVSHLRELEFRTAHYRLVWTQRFPVGLSRTDFPFILSGPGRPKVKLVTHTGTVVLVFCLDQRKETTSISRDLNSSPVDSRSGFGHDSSTRWYTDPKLNGLGVKGTTILLISLGRTPNVTTDPFHYVPFR